MRRTFLRSFFAAPALLALASCSPTVEHPAPASVIVAQFDPTANPPVVPTPTDLALVDGHPRFPDPPGASAAQKELNDYIRGLDGFPAETPASATFSGAIDPATVTTSLAGSVVAIDGTARVPLGPTDYAAALSDDGKTLSVTPTTGAWKLGHTYLILVFGGGDPSPDRHGDANGLRGKNNEPVIASQVIAFLRSSSPLLERCPDLSQPACQCPYDAAKKQFDSSCSPSVTGMTLAQAQQLEPLRQQAGQALDAIFAAYGGTRDRSNVALLFSFTIAHGPFAAFDPVHGRIPFPNDVLIDQTTRKVNLPIDPKLPDAQKRLLMGLDQLDGFSTTADELAPVDVADDAAGAGPVGVDAKSVGLLNVTSLGRAEYTASPQLVDMGKTYTGQIVITPTRPLASDQSRYAAWLTSDITDSKGRPLQPSPIARLIRARAPLVDASMKSTVNVLSDAQANQLEVLRLAYAPLFDSLETLFGVPRDKLAIAWTFTTQSEAKPLLDVAAYPGKKGLPTDVTVLAVEPGTAFGPDVKYLVHGRMHTHVALDAMNELDLAGGRDVDIPFLMAIPDVPVTSVVLAQHGLGGWRGDIRFLAQDWNAAGQALIGIDINYHGARSLCTASSQCAGGGTCGADGTCSTSLASRCTSDAQCAAGGTCDMTTGACSTSLAPQSGLCMTHSENGAPVTECKPAASGAAFLDIGNPFAIRDNLRQHVLDLTQLARVVADGSPSGLQAKLAATPQAIAIPADPSKLGYVGVSLGGIEGALFLSVAQTPTVGVLNVPGGRLVDVLVTSPEFSKLVGPLLAANNIAPDTAAYYQLLDTYRWIIDPGDPINFGRYVSGQPLVGVPPKAVIVQEAGADMVIPNPATDALAVEIGLPLVGGHPGVRAHLLSDPNGSPVLVSTYFDGAPHGFLFDPAAPGSLSARRQAITWIASRGTLITAP